MAGYFLLLIPALSIDALQAFTSLALAPIPVLGIILGIVISVCLSLTLGVAHTVSLHQFLSQGGRRYRAARLFLRFAPFLGEIIPVVNALPWWSLGTLLALLAHQRALKEAQREKVRPAPADFQNELSSESAAPRQGKRPRVEPWGGHSEEGGRDAREGEGVGSRTPLVDGIRSREPQRKNKASFPSRAREPAPTRDILEKRKAA